MVLTFFPYVLDTDRQRRGLYEDRVRQKDEIRPDRPAHPTGLVPHRLRRRRQICTVRGPAEGGGEIPQEDSREGQLEWPFI